jgi:hypothetical protein
MKATGRTRTKDGIFAVVGDDHNVLCLTEEMLDTWWRELAPEDKGALYELHLGGALDDPPVAAQITEHFDELAGSFYSSTSALRGLVDQLLTLQPQEAVHANL